MSSSLIHSLYKISPFVQFECISICSYNFAVEMLAVWQGEPFSGCCHWSFFCRYTEFKELLSYRSCCFKMVGGKPIHIWEQWS